MASKQRRTDLDAMTASEAILLAGSLNLYTILKYVMTLCINLE